MQLGLQHCMRSESAADVVDGISFTLGQLIALCHAVHVAPALEVLGGCYGHMGHGIVRLVAAAQDDALAQVHQPGICRPLACSHT